MRGRGAPRSCCRWARPRARPAPRPRARPPPRPRSAWARWRARRWAYRRASPRRRPRRPAAARRGRLGGARRARARAAPPRQPPAIADSSSRRLGGGDRRPPAPRRRASRWRRLGGRRTWLRRQRQPSLFAWQLFLAIFQREPTGDFQLAWAALASRSASFQCRRVAGAPSHTNLRASPMNVRLVSDSFLFEHITLTADDAEKAELVIGRSHRADYHIDHPQVSGLQCTLKVDMKPPHKLTLKDTSTNGTFVDGREIGRDKTVELTAGCTVTFLVNTVEEKDLEFGTEIPSFKVELRKPPRRLRDDDFAHPAAAADLAPTRRSTRVAAVAKAKPEPARRRPPIAEEGGSSPSPPRAPPPPPPPPPSPRARARARRRRGARCGGAARRCARRRGASPSRAASGRGGRRGAPRPDAVVRPARAHPRDARHALDAPRLRRLQPPPRVVVLRRRLLAAAAAGTLAPLAVVAPPLALPLPPRAADRRRRPPPRLERADRRRRRRPPPAPRHPRH